MINLKIQNYNFNKQLTNIIKQNLFYNNKQKLCSKLIINLMKL